MTDAPSTQHVPDVLRGVSAGLRHEFPHLPESRVQTSVALAAGRPASSLLPDLSAFAATVAFLARRSLAAIGGALPQA